MKEDTKLAVALAHSRECTKELISGLPSFCSQGTVELEQKKRNVLRKKTAAVVLPFNISFVVGALGIKYQLFLVGSATQVFGPQKHSQPREGIEQRPNRGSAIFSEPFT